MRNMNVDNETESVVDSQKDTDHHHHRHQSSTTTSSTDNSNGELDTLPTTKNVSDEAMDSGKKWKLKK